MLTLLLSPELQSKHGSLNKDALGPDDSLSTRIDGWQKL